jgi:hypothetical protein
MLASLKVLIFYAFTASFYWQTTAIFLSDLNLITIETPTETFDI